jgi:hypothetical protein
VPREDAREHGDEVRRHRAFAHLARAEIDRGRKVEQEPGRELAVLVVLAHVGSLQPGGDVPVDVTNVVAILVFAQVREIQTEAAEQRAVIALKQPVETAHHRPLQAAQDRLRISRRLPRL